jgi:hypothetical protein
VNNDKRIAKQLLNYQGFDVDEERIHIPSTKKRRMEVNEIQSRRQGEVCEGLCVRDRRNYTC